MDLETKQRKCLEQFHDAIKGLKQPKGATVIRIAANEKTFHFFMDAYLSNHGKAWFDSLVDLNLPDGTDPDPVVDDSLPDGVIDVKWVKTSH